MLVHVAAILACVIGSVPAVLSADAGSGHGTVSPSTSMNSPGFDAASEYRKGIDALKANQFADAKKSFAEVLGVAPEDANTNFLAGMADAGLNDLKSAAKHYEKAVRADSKLIPAQQELGVTYVKLGDLQKAQATLAKLQKMSDDCKGTCKDADNLKQAIDAVQAAIGQPAHAELQTAPPLLFQNAKGGDSAYLQAVSLINEHRYADAIVALERAKASFGAHPDILTYLGFANRKLRRYDIAQSYYQQALAADPNHKGATEYYGELMIERGDMAGAQRMLAKLDAICTFGCAEAEDLRRWIATKGAHGS
jgi:tetratricopeptide (TPR) repeat protein